MPALRTIIRRLLPAAFSALILAAGGWLWADKVDLAAVAEKLANMEPLFAAVSLTAWLAFSPVNAYRLKRVSGWVAGARVPYFSVLRVTCIGTFIAAAAPLGVLGDA